jgi:transporter family protein
MFSDWRVLTILSILSWGIWGILSKYVGNKIHWGEIMVLLGIGTFLVVLVTTPTSFAIKFNVYSLIALIAGIFCALGYYFFYRALVRGEASAVIPISSLYIVVAAVLAFLFMNEPVTVKKIFGILSAMAAIALLV